MSPRPLWMTGLLCLVLSCRAATVGAPLPRARTMILEGRAKDAVPILEAELGRAPRDLDVARALVEAHAKSGTLPELLRRLSDPSAPATPARLYMRALALFASDAAQVEPAAELLRSAIERDPTEPEFHHRLGVLLLDAELYERAAVALATAARLAPDRTSYALPLAKALARTGDRPGALAQLTRVARGSPTPAEVKLARALMDDLSAMGPQVPQAARDRLDQALAWLEERDAPSQAIAVLDGLLQEFPELPLAHTVLGLAHQRLDDVALAVESFRKAIELDPNDGRNHLYLGELYFARQRPTQAAEHFEKAIERHPFLDAAYERLGGLLMARRELDRAARLLRTLTHLRPDSSDAFVQLAAALQLQDDFRGAEAALERALALTPERLDLKLRLALFHVEWQGRQSRGRERDERRDRAARLLREVLDAQPGNAVASQALEALQSR